MKVTIAAPLAAGRPACRCRGGGRRSAAPCPGSSRRRAARRAAAATSLGARRRRSGRGRPRPRACAPAPPACGRGRRGGDWGPARRRAGASSSGRTTAVTPSSSSKPRPRSGSGPPSSRRSSASWRSPAGSPARSAAARASATVAGSISSSSSAARRAAAQQPQRVGGEAALADRPAGRRARDRARPPWGSIGAPPPSGTATAPTVKSRAPGRRSMPSPRSAVTSTCQARSRATTRQVPNSAESSKAWLAELAAIASAAAARVAGDGEVEVGHLPPEGRVANRAADDPDLRRAAERARRGRRRPSARCRGRCARAVTAHAARRGTRAEIPQVTS